jgi:hypothetical protein
MTGFDDRWFPFLTDAVEFTNETTGQCFQGIVSRYDPSLVEMTGPAPVAVGGRLASMWPMHGLMHGGYARVEEITADGYTVRLPERPAIPTSRRAQERLPVSVRVEVTSPFHGSLEGVAASGHTLDLSDGGARAVFAHGAPMQVGEILEVRLELADRVETLKAEVVWERGHGQGERLAGLKFQGEVEATAWAALAVAPG